MQWKDALLLAGFAFRWGIVHLKRCGVEDAPSLSGSGSSLYGFDDNFFSPIQNLRLQPDEAAGPIVR